MTDRDIITELDRLHRRACDLRARERQLADSGENDPASDAWKMAAILASSAESEFKGALVEAWPSISRKLREAEQWRTRESETQEALQAIGEEFGVHGGEPRVDGIRRVLTEQRDALAAILREAVEGWNFDMDAAPKTSEMDMAAKPFLGLCRDRIDDHVDQRIIWWEPKMNKGRGCWYSDRDLEEHPYAWRPLPAPPAEEGK